MRYIYGNLPTIDSIQSSDPGDIFVNMVTGQKWQNWNGEWRALPHEATDHSVYVKKTDYATASKVGVVKVGTGLSASSGTLSVDNPVPAYAAADANKVLTVNADGDATEWDAVPSELPSYTSSQAGNVLKVTSAGTGLEWGSAGATEIGIVGVVSGTSSNQEAVRIGNLVICEFQVLITADITASSRLFVLNGAAAKPAYANYAGVIHYSGDKTTYANITWDNSNKTGTVYPTGLGSDTILSGSWLIVHLMYLASNS